MLYSFRLSHWVHRRLSPSFCFARCWLVPRTVVSLHTYPSRSTVHTSAISRAAPLHSYLVSAVRPCDLARLSPSLSGRTCALVPRTNSRRPFSLNHLIVYTSAISCAIQHHSYLVYAVCRCDLARLSLSVKHRPTVG